MKRMIILALLALQATPVSADIYAYVGSWQVDQGPSWVTEPQAFSGQDAAAYLFGGDWLDYAISTNGPSRSKINYRAWVSVWRDADALECASLVCSANVAEDFANSSVYSNSGNVSAYVADHAIGPGFTNYAFRYFASVPEPATWALMIIGVALTGASLRRQRRPGLARRVA